MRSLWTYLGYATENEFDQDLDQLNDKMEEAITQAGGLLGKTFSQLNMTRDKLQYYYELLNDVAQ